MDGVRAEGHGRGRQGGRRISALGKLWEPKQEVPVGRGNCLVLKMICYRVRLKGFGQVW